MALRDGSETEDERRCADGEMAAVAWIGGSRTGRHLHRSFGGVIAAPARETRAEQIVTNLALLLPRSISDRSATDHTI